MTEAHHAVTWFLAGLIWTVQLVHYPLFESMRGPGFPAAHAFHSRRITYLVAPAMLAEFGLAAWLAAQRGWDDRPAVAGFALVVLIWSVTGLVMAPLHGKLAAGYSEQIHARLVRWNWLRTVAWSARGALCVCCL